MTVSAALAICTGWTVGSSGILAAVLVVAWLASIFLDSSALTAGTVQAADPSMRGATMGLHSMCRICRRVHRAARRWVCARYGGEKRGPWLGPRVRPTGGYFDYRFDFRAAVGMTRAARLAGSR